MMVVPHLCVNIDHIATLRQARGEDYPDLLEGAAICEQSGAAGITVHLREDRRHIQDDDVFRLKEKVAGIFNLEMALSDEIIGIARKIKPDQITLVPEKREELTTEGGLDVKSHFEKITSVVQEFQKNGITVSLFIEPDYETVSLSHDTGARCIEIHTGRYCNAAGSTQSEKELSRIFFAAEAAVKLGLVVNAGHGLNHLNLAPLMKTPGLNELNIGHSIISRAIFIGLQAAVKEILEIIRMAYR